MTCLSVRLSVWLRAEQQRQYYMLGGKGGVVWIGGTNPLTGNVAKALNCTIVSWSHTSVTCVVPPGEGTNLRLTLVQAGTISASAAPSGCRRSSHGWERATPVALFSLITHPMSAIGVARSQP